MDAQTPHEFLGAVADGVPVYERVLSVLSADYPDVSVRVSRSQLAFWRAHGFAYLWLPGQYLSSPRADLVLSIALPRHLGSDRFAEVAHPSPRVWMHHLDIRTSDDIDDEVSAWLRTAAGNAG